MVEQDTEKMSMEECQQKSFYCYISVTKQQYLGFLLVITYLSSGSWLPEQCQAGIISHRVGFNLIQVVTGYFHTFCASIAPAYHTGKSSLQLKALYLGCVCLTHEHQGDSFSKAKAFFFFFCLVKYVSTVFYNKALHSVYRE